MCLKFVTYLKFGEKKDHLNIRDVEYLEPCRVLNPSNPSHNYTSYNSEIAPWSLDFYLWFPSIEMKRLGGKVE